MRDLLETELKDDARAHLKLYLDEWERLQTAVAGER